MQYGKRSIIESYMDGKITKTQSAYSLPYVVKDKSQALIEVIRALDLGAVEKKTRKINFCVEFDKMYQPKMIVVEYTTDDLDKIP